ncbi:MULTISPECIES: hypothetical protein [Sorangium]|uniref:hypothetical protein n=1 Tax=Sorangium TaxID=39643 RepID=UPI003D9C57CE
MLEPKHRAALERLGLTVLPRYVNPGHHDPTSPEFIKYKNEKSQMPVHAERILRHAVPADGSPGCSTWWACCEHGFFHRYDGNDEGGLVNVHWNGTTNPNATGNRRAIRKATTAPTNVKDRLSAMPRVADCGCREVDR